MSLPNLCALKLGCTRAVGVGAEEATALPGGLEPDQIYEAIETLLRSESWEELTIKVILAKLEASLLPQHPPGTLRPHRKLVSERVDALMKALMAEQDTANAAPTAEEPAEEPAPADAEDAPPLGKRQGVLALLATIEGFEKSTDIQDEYEFQAILAEMDEMGTLTSEELTAIAHRINKIGIKRLVYLFLTKYPGALPASELRLNASHRWWMRRWDFPDMPILNLEMDAQGFVVVDLWHTRRGSIGPASFKEFRSGYPTFFLGSYGLVRDNLEDLQEYVEEAYRDEEDHNLYVKRGRFKFKPLLWFEDTQIVKLRDDREKSEIVAQLVNSHRILAADSFDLQQQNDVKWKQMLYYRREEIDGQKHAMPFRLDNNCVDDATIPLRAGYQGTLAVDVSGVGGAELPPGSVTPESQSVVIWDVPNTLVEEDEWELLIL